MACPDCDLLRAEQENDRVDYNVAVANGLIIKARSIDRRMKSREKRITEHMPCET